ncbi:MAG: hypothetical protein AB8G95_25245 [Anaerolineae bacterium]
MEYFKPTAEIRSTRNIIRILMVVSYLVGIGLWVFFLNQVFGYDQGEPSGNLDGLVYLPALFASPIIALLFVPPFVWLGSLWQTRKISEGLNEPHLKIWFHTQPLFSLILSAISLFVYFILGVIALLFM